MHIVDKLLQPINTSVVSLFGFFNAWYGLWFLLPFAETLPIFEYIGIPTFSYGVFGIAVGIVSIYGGIRGSKEALSVASLMGFIFWTYTVVAFLLVSWMNPAWILALNWATYALFLRINIKVNLNESQEKYQDNLFGD